MEFLFLTKFPQRLAELEWPENAWCGTTVDTQDRVKIAEKSFANLTAGKKWLSCEPMLERLTFNALEIFQYLVIGASTESSQTPEYQPPLDHVLWLIEQADRVGTQVFMKDNLGCLRAYPG